MEPNDKNLVSIATIVRQIQGEKEEASKEAAMHALGRSSLQSKEVTRQYNYSIIPLCSLCYNASIKLNYPVSRTTKKEKRLSSCTGSLLSTSLYTFRTVSRANSSQLQSCQTQSNPNKWLKSPSLQVNNLQQKNVIEIQ